MNDDNRQPTHNTLLDLDKLTTGAIVSMTAALREAIDAENERNPLMNLGPDQDERKFGQLIEYLSVYRGPDLSRSAVDNDIEANQRRALKVYMDRQNRGERAR